MRMARAAAIEKNRAGYLHLECDHITTYEEQVIIECFFTKRPKGKYWCEQCGNWQKQMRYKAEVLPQEPGF